MTRYRMTDGTIVDTERARQTWGQADTSQAIKQTLAETRKGRYYVEYTSEQSWHRDHVEWVSPEEACRWLLFNHCDETMPDELRETAEGLLE